MIAINTILCFLASNLELKSHSKRWPKAGGRGKASKSSRVHISTEMHRNERKPACSSGTSRLTHRLRGNVHPEELLPLHDNRSACFLPTATRSQRHLKRSRGNTCVGKGVTAHAHFQELTWVRCSWWSWRLPPGWLAHCPWLVQRYWTPLVQCSRTRCSAYLGLHLYSRLRE